ncbi:MAG: putative metal-dependent hydrolase [Ignavibacteriales bacterium]|nr:putative metal-dependent hydrolase [Ignavibacteriales bacterium]
MLTPSERNEWIQKIQQLPLKLETAVQGLSDTQLNTSTGEGKWTSRQIAHHIADANINAYSRMKLIVTEEKPILKPYNQDQWASLADCKNGPIEPTLTLVKGLHERWLIFLRSLPEPSWAREGIHLENGKVTLDDVLRIYSKHGETHVQQIISFREKMKW